MDRMAAIERVTEGLMLLREGSHNTRRACVELSEALDLLDYEKQEEALDERERQVLEFLATWEGARSPTFQQIADGCDAVIQNCDVRLICRSSGPVDDGAPAYDHVE